MAVYTPLSDSDLAALLAQYDIGAALTCEGIAEGVENTNFKLTTATSRYILTIFEKRTPEADLPFFMGVMEQLAARGFPAPRPIATRDGAHVARVAGKSAAVVSFLDGAWPRNWGVAHCAAVGDALARMHVALDGFGVERHNKLSIDGWEKLLRPRLSEAEALRPGLAALIERDMAEVRAAWPSALQRGAIHADMFPDNVFFEGERVSGVIDFYFACTDFLTYDLAVCLNAWCFDGPRYDIERSRAMIGAYEQVRPLSADERAALPVLSRGAALRFFATRLADWSATPDGATVTPKDPLEYADKLAFHRIARADMTDATHSRRFVFAGLIAPIVGGVWAGLLSSILLAASGDAYQWPPTFAFMIALTSIYAVAITLPLTWTLGLAWHVLACAKGWRSLAAYAAVGSSAGSVIALVIYLLSGATWTTATWFGLFWFGSTGAIIAFTGWLIRRPDRDVANPHRSSP